MEKITLAGVSIVFISAFVAGFAGYIWKRVGKIEDILEKANKSIDSDSCRIICKEEIRPITNQINGVKSDFGSLAESIRQSVDKQEAKLDQLVLHLLNDRGSRK